MNNKSSTRPRRPRPDHRAGPSTVPDTRSRRDADILTERGAQHAARRGRNIGVVAAARELTELVFYGLRDGDIRRLSTPPQPAA